ncbi:MAG TPA: nuclear transport factor 2 family protein [Roseateles sp.]
MTPSEVVEQQVAAFNGKDERAFLALFAADVCVYDMPAVQPRLVGKAAFAAAYARPFANPQLHVEILSRMAVGSKVVDHERVHGWKPQACDFVAVYEVREGLIRALWLFEADAAPQPPA